ALSPETLTPPTPESPLSSSICFSSSMRGRSNSRAYWDWIAMLGCGCSTAGSPFQRTPERCAETSPQGPGRHRAARGSGRAGLGGGRGERVPGGPERLELPETRRVTPECGGHGDRHVELLLHGLGHGEFGVAAALAAGAVVLGEDAVDEHPLDGERQLTQRVHDPAGARDRAFLGAAHHHEPRLVGRSERLGKAVHAP